MPNEPTEFRDRLLNAQQTTPALREEYLKELQGILTNKLTPAGRVINGVMLLVWLIFAGACIGAGIVHRGTPRATADFWINLVMYFAVFVLLSLGTIRNLRKGEHTWRAYFRVAEMFYCAAGVTVALVLLRGMRAPHDPASTFGAIYALVFLIVSLGWALQNRIDAALLKTREGMLRIESRLADLAERMPK